MAGRACQRIPDRERRGSMPQTLRTASRLKDCRMASSGGPSLAFLPHSEEAGPLDPVLDIVPTHVELRRQLSWVCLPSFDPIEKTLVGNEACCTNAEGLILHSLAKGSPPHRIASKLKTHPRVAQLDMDDFFHEANPLTVFVVVGV